jgi:hypothetical protein
MREPHSLPLHCSSPLAGHFAFRTVAKTYTNPNPKIPNTCTLCLVVNLKLHTIGIGAATINMSMIKSESASAAVAPLVSSQYSSICFALVHAAAGRVPHWKIFAPRNASVHEIIRTIRNIEYTLNVLLIENIRRYKNTTLSLMRPSARILRMRMISMYFTFSESSGVRDAAPVSGSWSVCVPKKRLDAPVRISVVMGHMTIWYLIRLGGYELGRVRVKYHASTSCPVIYLEVRFLENAYAHAGEEGGCAHAWEDCT